MVLHINDYFKDLLEDLSLEMKRTIHARVDPANAPMTIEKKGFDFPLVETTEMMDAITYIMDSETAGRVGVFDSDNAQKAMANQALGIEFEMSKVPGRPFMRITIDTKLDELMKKFEDSFFDDVVNELR